MTEVTRMEQQERALQKQTAPQEPSHKELQSQARRSFAGLTAQAILDGAAIWELPRSSLEELAERVGNSAMLALTAMGMPEADLRQTSLIGMEPQTPAMEVPDMDCRLAPAADLTAGPWPSVACDPAALT